MIGATGLLIGIAIAIYKNTDEDKKPKYKSMFISTIAAVLLTGVTEPLEFMFMFAALPLYVVYSVLQGLAFASAGIVNLRLHSFGNLEFLTRMPMSIKAGLMGDIINFFICVIIFLIVGYLVANFMIKKFNYATVGRLGNYIDEEKEEETTPSTKENAGNTQASRVIELLGGKDNIVDVDACMTRLRVTVKDETKVADLEDWKKREH